MSRGAKPCAKKWSRPCRSSSASLRPERAPWATSSCPRSGPAFSPSMVREPWARHWPAGRRPPPSRWSCSSTRSTRSSATRCWRCCGNYEPATTADPRAFRRVCSCAECATCATTASIPRRPTPSSPVGARSTSRRAPCAWATSRSIRCRPCSPSTPQQPGRHSPRKHWP